MLEWPYFPHELAWNAAVMARKSADMWARRSHPFDALFLHYLEQEKYLECNYFVCTPCIAVRSKPPRIQDFGAPSSHESLIGPRFRKNSIPPG
ncbi:hypothetical protein Zmor_022346 [Zophobas morio]|uniref:Uncharacterized protein n=1 Tax=Zophobas morio TaxID=2755281 RepID=A0AA38HVH1_9CUCU|nr:hypothetical protein Zmor_022346 [Zophobas morio]